MTTALLVRESVPEPVMVDRDGNEYYLEVWNEPRYKQQREV
jgi:hypothetical protein